jgi:signal transduction histidine kinase
VASVIAAYSAPMYSHYRNLALTSVVLAALWFIASNRNDLPGLPSSVVTFLLVASVGLAANAIHTWRQRAQALQRDQETTTRLAVDRERARLARELHDVVGHNVSVMVVQAGAARKVMNTSPDLAREALLAVEAGGRAAMTELRQVIGLLTLTAEDGARRSEQLDPPPGLDRLPELAERIRETGVPVTLTVSGPIGALPPGVDLAAYRVVQEALTNAVRHAVGAAVAIQVTGSAGELRIEVTDTGGTTSAAGAGGGAGLAGLRERLSGYGGTLTTGPRPTAGYRVTAVIPLPEDP